MNKQTYANLVEQNKQLRKRAEAVALEYLSIAHPSVAVANCQFESVEFQSEEMTFRYGWTKNGTRYEEEIIDLISIPAAYLWTDNWQESLRHHEK